MPSGDALLGVGFSAHQADQLGGNPSICTAVGTAQAGAKKVLTKNVELVTSGGQTAVIIPNGDICQPYFFTNPAATSGLIFPPVGHTLNGTLNASLTLAQNKSAIVWQYKPGLWTSILTA